MNPLNMHCKRCGLSFDRGEQMSLYNQQYYHNKCFVCNFCETSLAGQGFFTKPDGSFQCKRCHEYHTPKCFICNNSIADGVKVRGIFWNLFSHKKPNFHLFQNNQTALFHIIDILNQATFKKFCLESHNNLCFSL